WKFKTHGAFIKPPEHCCELLAKLWKGFMARLFGCAVVEHSVHRVLHTFGPRQWQLVIDRRNPAHYHRAHASRMLTQIDERGVRAVRSAVYVYAIVAKCLAYFIQIVDRDRRRVQRQIRVLLKLDPTRANAVGREKLLIKV